MDNKRIISVRYLKAPLSLPGNPCVPVKIIIHNSMMAQYLEVLFYYWFHISLAVTGFKKR